MDLKSGTLLVPPTVKNSSCSHPRYTSHNFLQHIGIAETIEAVLILILTLGVIGANALVIFIINNRRYSAYIHQQPRYLLTSLALNDLTIGLLITPFGLLPALTHCWPYGEIFCQIQALLRGALSQQSAVILVCMAVDRYMCALHPRRYYQHSSKKGCVAILSLTWICCLIVFGFLVLPKGYYFNNTGLMACEPFFSKPSYRILATCSFYFPTTMILMYCYGSSFHMSRFRLNDPTMPLTAAAHHPAAHQHPLQHLHQHFPLHNYQHYHQHQHPHQHQHQHQHPHLHHQYQHPHQHSFQPQDQHHSHMHHSHRHHYPQMGMSRSGSANTIATGTATATATATATSGGGTNLTPSTILPNNPFMNFNMAMGMGMGLGMGMGIGMGPSNTITKKIVPIQEKNSSGATSRSMAAISLGFIVMVTPWTIQEIVAACTGSKLPPFLDFLVTWIALSNSFWNPFMYWLLNADFRRLSKQMLPSKCKGRDVTPEHKSPCCHINTDFEITTLPMPPEPPTSRPPLKHQNNCDGSDRHDNEPSGDGSGTAGGGGADGAAGKKKEENLTKVSGSTAGSGSGSGTGSAVRGSVLGICTRRRTNSLSRSNSFHIRSSSAAAVADSRQYLNSGPNNRPDIEGLSEKYWGEILERTVSSNSLHAALQKTYPAFKSSTASSYHHHRYQHHQQQQQSQQQQQQQQHSYYPQTMTTSFTKSSDLNLHIKEGDDMQGIVDAANPYIEASLSPTVAATTANSTATGSAAGIFSRHLNHKLSTSVPKLCEYDPQAALNQNYQCQQQQPHCPQHLQFCARSKQHNSDVMFLAITPTLPVQVPVATSSTATSATLPATFRTPTVSGSALADDSNCLTRGRTEDNASHLFNSKHNTPDI